MTNEKNDKWRAFQKLHLIANLIVTKLKQQNGAFTTYMALSCIVFSFKSQRWPFLLILTLGKSTDAIVYLQEWVCLDPLQINQ